MPLTKDQILSADDLSTESVSVPEWGGDVLIRCLTGSERDSFEAALDSLKKSGRPLHNIRARLAAMSIVDEQGNRLFSDAEIDALGKKSSSALNRVFEAATKLSRFSEESVKELEKNSVGDQ